MLDEYAMVATGVTRDGTLACQGESLYASFIYQHQDQVSAQSADML